jgi:hypothetical protein
MLFIPEVAKPGPVNPNSDLCPGTDIMQALQPILEGLFAVFSNVLLD